MTNPIKHWIVTGDTHGQVEERLQAITSTSNDYTADTTAVIILGDAGINYYLNKSEQKRKYWLNAYGYKIYCVRGNHEERPENLDMTLTYDENVQGWICLEPEFPNLRYFLDGGEYVINEHPVLVIGGACSIDKYYRLERAEMLGMSFSGWFKDEQLTTDEMSAISKKVVDKHYDFVFTHTCPIDWEPRDLFIGGIDQSKVDKSMELWLNTIKDTCQWNVWCFGHYHADRIERPHVEQFFIEHDELETIWNRWNKAHTSENNDE